LPLGVDAELPWHTSLPETRRVLRTLGALSLNVDGQPTARLRWGDVVVRATLEFVDGVHCGENTWLAAHPNVHFMTRDGLRVRMEPRLRAANVHYPQRNPRGNWQRAIALLGRPTRRERDGTWVWEWPRMTARWIDSKPGEDAPECLRFASTASSRVLEIRNQSSLELYTKIAVRVDFPDGTWESGEPPKLAGIPVRLHWDTPVDVPLLVTVTGAGREVAVEVPKHIRKVVITNDGAGGVRAVI
jgi:hypothetical protein